MIFDLWLLSHFVMQQPKINFCVVFSLFETWYKALLFDFTNLYGM